MIILIRNIISSKIIIMLRYINLSSNVTIIVIFPFKWRNKSRDYDENDDDESSLFEAHA